MTYKDRASILILQNIVTFSNLLNEQVKEQVFCSSTYRNYQNFLLLRISPLYLAKDCIILKSVIWPYLQNCILPHQAGQEIERILSLLADSVTAHAAWWSERHKMHNLFLHRFVLMLQYSRILIPVWSQTYLASNPTALQHSVKQLAHSPQRPRLVSRSFSGLLYLQDKYNTKQQELKIHFTFQKSLHRFLMIWTDFSINQSTEDNGNNCYTAQNTSEQNATSTHIIPWYIYSSIKTNVVKSSKLI